MHNNTNSIYFSHFWSNMGWRSQCKFLPFFNNAEHQQQHKYLWQQVKRRYSCEYTLKILLHANIYYYEQEVNRGPGLSKNGRSTKKMKFAKSTSNLTNCAKCLKQQTYIVKNYFYY